MLERELIEGLLRPVATHKAAGALLDDAAVLTPPLGRDLVLTHDMLAEGVHFLPDDPPADIGHKLLAVNLSDLAAMGARPVAALMGLGLSPRQDAAWLEAFVGGLRATAERFALPLIGGDTIAGLDRLVLGLTAIGDVPPGAAVSRAGAQPGDRLWVSGSIGDAALGLRLLRGEIAVREEDHAERLLGAYRRPEPRVDLGLALRGLATAALDLSDGLLLDAKRLAEASGLAATIDLRLLPVSRAAEALAADRLALATGGDDYEMLFAAPAAAEAEVAAAARAHKLRLTAVGHLNEGAGLTVISPEGLPIEPEHLGFEHGRTRP